MQTESLHHLSLKAPPQDYKPMSMVETTRDLHRRHGFPVFWRGLTASLLGLSHVAIQFPVYEHLKSNLSNTPDSGPR